MDKLETFIHRFERIGINISLVGNYPWVYVYSINDKKVIEKFCANHGFCIAYLPIRKNEDVVFSNISEVFKLIRKYVGNTTKK